MWRRGLILLCATGSCLLAQTDLSRELRGKFESELKDIDSRFDGVFGASFVDLTSREKIGIHDDNIFPTASTIKVPVLIELFRQADQNPAILRKQLPVTSKTQVAGSGILKILGDGTSSLALGDLARLMINLSDNTASNMVIDAVGIVNVNRLIESLGLKTMKLQRRMMDSASVVAGRDNISSPADAAAIMTRIAQCDLPVSKAGCNEIRRILEIPQSAHPAKEPILRNIPIAFKWGATEGVAAAWAIVNLPDRPYVFAIMTTYGADADATLRAASDAAWRYYSRLARANEYGDRSPLDAVRKERPGPQ